MMAALPSIYFDTRGTKWTVPRKWLDARRGLLAKAQEIAPDDPRIWRSRAYLEVEYVVDGAVPLPQRHTLAMLREAQRHDPDNALYDYLAAQYLEGGHGLMRPAILGHHDEKPSDDGQWFLRRMPSIGKLPFAAEAADRHLLQRRCLARLRLSPTERQEIARELLWHDQNLSVLETVGEQVGYGPYSNDTCWGVIGNSVTADVIRRQFTLHGTSSPRIDVGLRSLDHVSLQNSKFAAVTRHAPEGELEKFERHLHTLIQELHAAEIAGRRLRENLPKWTIKMPKFSRLTRSFAILVSCALVALGSAGIPLRNWRQAPPSSESGGKLWIRLIVTLTGGIAIALGLSSTVFFCDQVPVVAFVVDLILWIPALTTVPVGVWAFLRLLKLRRRRVRAVGLILGGLFCVDWGILYWSVVSKARWTVASGVTNVSHLIINGGPFKSEIGSYVWSYREGTKSMCDGLMEAAILLIIPLGVVLAAGMFWAAVVMTTPGTAGRSLWDWLIARTSNITPELVAPRTGWFQSMLRETSRGWLTLGLWLLTFSLVTTGLQMQSAEVIYQREFGTGATPERLWQEYQWFLRNRSASNN
ncbi:MAG: hypothetical protein NT069_01235 [Planctomycetota bacterium]|nr:hypothetical protein [Planctomycetota bacterium]